MPRQPSAPRHHPEAVLDTARRGAALGCKEALFTLGDRPEEGWPQARQWLEAHGYEDTLSYVRAMAIRVLEETGLLPHLNPGVLSWTDFQRLKPVAPSMGMMLETTATRLWSEPGGCHHGSPDKEPAVRLRVLEDAGRTGVPSSAEPPDHPLELLTQPLRVRTVVAYRQERFDQLPLLVGELPARHDRLPIGSAFLPDPDRQA